MSVDNVQALRELAEATPPGPWINENDSLYFKDDGYTRHLLDADSGSDVEEDAYYAALKFIAAANPAAVLELTKEVERGQRMLVAACVSLGSISEALGAEMDDDADEILGLVNDLKEDNKRLRRDAECAAAKQAHAEMIGDGFYSESEKIRAENEALRKDAERYRWLRNQVENCEWMAGVSRIVDKWGAAEEERVSDAADLDQTIDAAMAPQPLNPA